MTSAWDRAKEIADKHTLFVRLANDGDAVVGAFVGEPAARELHWAESKYEECVGDGCERCRGGQKPTFRVMFNFFVPSEGAMKVIEGATALFGAVLGVREKYALDQWLFEVKRIGAARDPRTTFTVLPEKQVDAETAAKIRGTPLIPLAAIGRGDSERANAPTIPAPPPTHESNDIEPMPF